MTQIFGDYVEPADDIEHLVIHFSPTAIPLQQRWRNNGLSADFLAEYWATFFPASDALSESRQKALKGAIAYIANELLENVMKFNYNPAQCSVNLGLYLHERELRFYTSNAVAPENLEPFLNRVRKLMTEDTAELYIHQIEQNALSENAGGSCLGLLTMIHDYDAQLAWKFEEVICGTASSELILVYTLVRLVI
ncbi:MAG: ATP-binding protein [Anaerolineae bacterium]|nr:ATP-binding protein [Anaerolineae bacterium]